MKKIISVSTIFVILFFLFSCAAKQKALSDKYNFDNYLEMVDQISSFEYPSLEQVDKQSVILKINYNEYYLLVLHRPINILHQPLGLENRGPNIIAGHDRIYMDDTVSRQYYVIDKIYKLKGKEQLKEIRERLQDKD